MVNDTENLHGQWSIDIMQEGDVLYLIDMAPAADSALKECAGSRITAKTEPDWLAGIGV